MCGIYGWFRLGNEKDIEMSNDRLSACLRYLAVKNEERGKDSSGVCTVDSKGIPFILKGVIPSSQFITSEKGKELFTEKIKTSCRFVLGHTRQATTGAVTFQNAQPFRYGSIIGIHNGIISNFKYVQKKHNLKNYTTCDSEILFSMLSKRKTLKGMATALSELNGYWSIAVHDLRQPDKIIFSQSFNTLTVALDSKKQYGFFTSHKDVMDNLCLIFGLTLTTIPIIDGTMFSIGKGGVMETEHIDGLAPYGASRYSYHYPDYASSYDGDADGAFGANDFADRLDREKEKDERKEKQTDEEAKEEESLKLRKKQQEKACSICEHLKKCRWSERYKKYLCSGCIKHANYYFEKFGTETEKGILTDKNAILQQGEI